MIKRQIRDNRELSFMLQASYILRTMYMSCPCLRVASIILYYVHVHVPCFFLKRFCKKIANSLPFCTSMCHSKNERHRIHLVLYIVWFCTCSINHTYTCTRTLLPKCALECFNFN